MNPSPTSSFEHRPAKPPTSVGQVFALVAGFLALAAIGATLGWTLTDTNASTPLATPPSTPVAVTSAPPPPSPTPSPTPSGYRLPDFVNPGTTFEDARTQLLAQGIGVLLIFDQKGVGNDDVTSTDPVAGTVLSRGRTVKLSVGEAAPPLAVPYYLGLQCSTVGHTISADGFSPTYPNGKSGVVTGQMPVPDTDPTNPGGFWNETITITCGTQTAPPPSPSVSPSPSPAD